MYRYIYLILLTLLLDTTIVFANSQFSVFNLKCEQCNNPLGIETLKPRFSWQIHALGRNFEQSAWQILVSDEIGLLKAEQGNVWDSGKIESSKSILNEFNGGKLKSGKTYFWKVRIWDKLGECSAWSQINRFSMGLISEKDWNHASWISFEKDKKEEFLVPGLHGLGEVNEKLRPDQKIGMYKLPQFRKEFLVKKSLKKAVAYVSGLGHFDMYINGKKVGNHFLDPGWTKYDKCALYVPFDISDMLQEGNNAVGVMLGNGFFNVPRERYFKLLLSYGAPRMIMKISLEYSDGTEECIVTDSSWKTTESPITYSSIYGGEDYNATLVQNGWNEPGFNDQLWKKALVSDWKTKMIAQASYPLTVRDTISTMRLFKNQKGKWVYDLGQNFSGIISVELKSKKNQSIRFYPAELLNADSTVNQSASGSPYWFTYTSNGGSKEKWEPQFTYYGMRYIQIEGAVPQGMSNPECLPEILSLRGMHTCNSAPVVGDFYCSKALFNQTYNLIDWAMRSNMVSVLTDCPHREKLGWLEEAHLMQYSLQYRYHLARLYEKTMNDMYSSQTEKGLIPDIAPEFVEFRDGFRDTPEWGSAFIISPWYIYQWYGDSRLIEKYYPAMKRYLEYLKSKSNDNIVAYGLGDWFDIGPKSPGYSQLTSNGVTATAIYYYDVSLMSKMAQLLGKIRDVQYYTNLAVQIKDSFNKTYWNRDKKIYDRNSQTANAIALFVGLTTEENEQIVLNNLVKDIRSRNNALTGGDVGYRYILRALEERNYSDVIFDMNSKYDTPGYGWQLAHGATALTESWQAYGFVSNNHFMLGHLMEWFFSGLGGIKQNKESIGYKNVIIDPSLVGDVRFCKTSYNSPYGIIVSDWVKENGVFTIRVEVPANSFACVYLPTSKVENITESGMKISEMKEISFVQENSRVKLNIGSGIYRFKVVF